MPAQRDNLLRVIPHSPLDKCISEFAAEPPDRAIADYLKGPTGIERVTFVLFGQTALDAHIRAWRTCWTATRPCSAPEILTSPTMCDMIST